MDKQQLTDAFVTKYKTAPTSEDKAIFHRAIWKHPFSKISLQLSEYGFKCLTETLLLQHYRYKLSKPLPHTGKVLLQLCKHLTAPFYIIDRETIVLFGEQDGIMLALSNFDLADFLNNQSQ